MRQIRFRIEWGLIVALSLTVLAGHQFREPVPVFPVHVQPVDPLITALHNKQSKKDVIAVEVRRLAKLYEKDGVTVPLILAVAEVESGFRQNAIGRSGEIGLMQVKPRTARAILTDMGLEPGAIYDPAVNLAVGAHYLVLIHRAMVAGGYEQQNEFKASIVAYNAGVTRTITAMRGGDPMPLRHYAKVRVAMMRWHKVLGGEI